MIRDLKGFEALGTAFSWPEFDELGLLSRPGHAVSVTPHLTACGEPWPHRWDEGRGAPLWTPPPGDPTREAPARLVPDAARVEEIRWAEDRTKYLCAACLRAITPRPA